MILITGEFSEMSIKVCRFYSTCPRTFGYPLVCSIVYTTSFIFAFMSPQSCFRRFIYFQKRPNSKNKLKHMFSNGVHFVQHLNITRFPCSQILLHIPKRLIKLTFMISVFYFRRTLSLWKIRTDVSVHLPLHGWHKLWRHHRGMSKWVCSRLGWWYMPTGWVFKYN